MLEDVIMADKENLERIKKSIAKKGAEKIHVLADFDRTLTKAFVDGQEIPSLISVLRDGNYLTKDYAGKAKALYTKYHPIEINAKIPLEEKRRAMLEWWTTHFELLIKSGLNKKDLENVVNSGRVRFREGALDFIDLLHENKIPLVIISSSGLGGDSISMYLEKEGRRYDNIYVISNSFEWDSEGNAVDVKKPIIHGMNKDETAIRKYPIFNVIKNRRNILLLGDNLSDVGMVKGFDYDNLIKVGFLNENVEENLEEYKRNFDVVLLNDAKMGYINNLIRQLIGNR